MATTTARTAPPTTSSAQDPRVRRLRRSADVTGRALALATGAGYLGLRYLARPKFPVLYDERLAAGATSSLELAPVAEALSFARADVGGSAAVLLVTSYQDDTVTGVAVLRADGTPYPEPVAAVRELGYPAIAALATSPSSVSVPVTELLPAVDAGLAHVALGTNYADHAQETEVSGVFLFPKRVQPTASRSSLPAGQGLLDYEVELALVPLGDITAADPAPGAMGLVLVNDLTDRQVLLEQADARDITSGRGFTNAKSQPGFLPVGDLFVVPADWRTFYRQLQLETYVDGRLRQRGTPADLIRGPEEMLAEIFAAGDRTWDHDGVPVHVTDEVGTVRAGSLILTGTPAGVAFRPPGSRQIALGVIEHAVTLGTNAASVVASAVGVYVREAHAARAYLQPGQQVVTRAQRLGQTVTTIVANPPVAAA